MKASWNVYKQLSATLSLQREMQISMFHPNGKFLYASKHLKEDGIIVYSIDSQKEPLVQIRISANRSLSAKFCHLSGWLLFGSGLQGCQLHTDIRKKPKYGVTEDTGKNIRLERPAFVKFL